MSSSPVPKTRTVYGVIGVLKLLAGIFHNFFCFSTFFVYLGITCRAIKMFMKLSTLFERRSFKHCYLPQLSHSCIIIINVSSIFFLL